MPRMCSLPKGASNYASGEALKIIRGGSVLEYVTGADNFRNEASGAVSRAFKEEAAYEY